MSRLSCIAVLAFVVACSKKADPPPAPTPKPTTTAPPAPAPDAAPAPMIDQVPGEAAILYGEEQVRQACTLVVTLRDRIVACDGGGKAVEVEQKTVDSLKTALERGMPSAEVRAKAMAACQRTEQRLRTIATDIKCTL